MTTRSLLVPTSYAAFWAVTDLFGDELVKVLSFMGEFVVFAASLGAMCMFLPRLSIRGKLAMTALPIAAVWIMAAVVQDALTPGFYILSLCLSVAMFVQLSRQRWVLR